jgi:hypothetical protein
MFLINVVSLLIALFGGIVVNRYIARTMFSALADITDRQVLLFGLFVSIIINGTVGTYLSIINIFNLQICAAVFFVVMFLLRQDLLATRTTTFQIIEEYINNIRHLKPMTVTVTCLFTALLVILSVLCLIPTQNPDTWAFHLPIAQSFINNLGFVYPAIDGLSLHYSNQPAFVQLLFAQFLEITPHFALAAFVSVLIYLLMFVVLANVWENFGLALGLLLVSVAFSLSFATQVPIPLTDMSRSCFSILGLTFLAVYLDRRIPYYAGLASICIGAAIATKYTELTTLTILALTLMPELKTTSGRRLILKCGVIIFVIASFWYIKNLILFKNPIYPFIFGHPGLSDEWMAGYLKEMTTAFDPIYRHFNRNLLTIEGWRDFLLVTWTWFFQDNFVAVSFLILSLVGAILFPRKIIYMFGCSIFLFIFWYVVMFNHIRWAKPATLLLFVTGCFTLLSFYEKYNVHLKYKLQLLTLLTRFKAYIFFIMALVGCFIALAVQNNAATNASASVSKRWNVGAATEIFFAAFSERARDNYLSRKREGYAIYRYIAQNDLANVFQPFHILYTLYAKVYNNRFESTWFVLEAPSDPVDIEGFIERNKIEYFVVQPPLSELVVELLGPEYVKTAYLILEKLMNGAELVLEDGLGSRLYKVK